MIDEKQLQLEAARMREALENICKTRPEHIEWQGKTLDEKMLAEHKKWGDLAVKRLKIAEKALSSTVGKEFLEEVEGLRESEKTFDKSSARWSEMYDEDQVVIEKLRAQVKELEERIEHITNEESWAKSIGKETIEDLQTKLTQSDRDFIQADKEIEALKECTEWIREWGVSIIKNYEDLQSQLSKTWQKKWSLRKRVEQLEGDQPLAFIKGLNRLHERACIYYERKRFKKVVKSLIRVQNICGKEYLEEIDDLQAQLTKTHSDLMDKDNELRAHVMAVTDPLRAKLAEAQEREMVKDAAIEKCMVHLDCNKNNSDWFYLHAALNGVSKGGLAPPEKPYKAPNVVKGMKFNLYYETPLKKPQPTDKNGKDIELGHWMKGENVVGEVINISDDGRVRVKIKCLDPQEEGDIDDLTKWEVLGNLSALGETEGKLKK